MAQRIAPATGLAVPASSFFSYRKNELRSRVAAKPMPRTSGSFAVYCSSYSSDGLNPFFRQICVVSGTPGNGVVSHVANAQSVLAIFTTPLFAPIGVSATADTRLAAAVSSVAGGYSVGVPRGMIKVVVVPVTPVSLITNGPVILLPSGFLARGT